MAYKKRIVAAVLTMLLFVMVSLSLVSCGFDGPATNAPTQTEEPAAKIALSFMSAEECHALLAITGAEQLGFPEDPVKNGYRFDGWFWDDGVWSKPFAASELFDGTITGDTSVYAKFTPITYQVTYVADGGTHQNPDSYTIESGIVLTDAEKTGCTFAGWYADESYQTQVLTIPAGSTGDITLYAKFEEITYSITYENIKDAENTNPQHYTVTTDTITFAPLTKDGYTFVGWYAADTAVTELPKGSVGDLTLIAKWDLVSYAVRYYNVSGATHQNPDTYDVKDPDLPLLEANKPGYRFAGWYKDQALTKKIEKIAAGTTGELHFYAKWEAIEYTATFKDGDTVVGTAKFTVETTEITPPPVPERVGYAGEWEDFTLGMQDITVQVQYTLQEHVLNGVLLSEYTIVYSASDPDYTQRAAIYLRDQIAERTGIYLTVASDQEQTTPYEHELVVGETNRAISAALDMEREGFQFTLLANNGHVAMEGDYFVIAAAAFYFVDTYITREPTDFTVDQVQALHAPIVEEAKNCIFLIGDGMGVNQTKLFSAYSAEALGAFSDGESEFYGDLFSYIGFARTNSLSGTTDSAAAGTALATGYKTVNGYIGKDGSLNDVMSLTEIAISLEKATAVMSTEALTGATPAAFSAHANNRGDTADILACQQLLQETCGTLILGDYGANYDESIIRKVEQDLQDTLAKLSVDEDGFFLMYEEAYIDKHSHSNERRNTFRAVLRFNQIIGCVMEYAFYNPDTFVLITADHETGGLTKAEDGTYYYTTGGHTSADVPVFAYGAGAEVFGSITVENIQIPKTIAAMWGVELTGYDNENYPALTPIAAQVPAF